MTDEPRVLGGRYEVGELIGRGGMAEVHAGHDVRLGRKVAIKILRTDLARDNSFLARFRREAQSAAGLNHPAIVAVYDSGEDLISEAGGAPVQVPYIIMEHVDGKTLREILNDEKVLDPDEAARVTASVLGALEYSHERGIVHRDIKPANVMVTKGGAVKVMDFGIARALADTAATMTQTQAVLGTARYLSPEQAQGLDVDTRSDLYSAGCLFYELLTGRTPFVGDPVSLVYQHLGEVPKPPSEHQTDLAASMDAVALHSLEKKPEDRYQTALDFRNDLHSARAGEPVSQPAQDSLQKVIGAGAAAAGLAGATEMITTATPAAAGPPPEQVAWGRDPEPGDDDFEDTDEMPVREERHRGGWIVVGILGLLALIAVIWIIVAMGGGEDDDDPPPAPPPTEEPATVDVENVVGMQEDDATDALEAQDLVVEVATASQTEVENSDADPGEVIAQDPEAGESAEVGDTVTITVVPEPEDETIPAVRGLSVDEARAELEELGFVVADDPETINDFSTLDEDEVPNPGQVEPGNVLMTDPIAGESAVPGTDEISLFLAGQNVLVPALAEQTEDDAVALLGQIWISEDRENLVIEEEDHDEIPEGQVVRTAPGPQNSFNRESDTLTIYISAGEPEPETVDIPDLRGESADSARSTLDDLGLTVAEDNEVEDDLEVGSGEVTRTSPAAGESVEEDSTVTIYVSRGTVEMPNLIGMSSNDAANELGENDLRWTFEFEDDDGEPNQVLRQENEDGEEINPNDDVDRGSQITLVISRSPGEEDPDVPDDT